MERVPSMSKNRIFLSLHAVSPAASLTVPSTNLSAASHTAMPISSLAALSAAMPISSLAAWDAAIPAASAFIPSASLSASLSAVLSAVPSILILLISPVLSNSFTHPQHMQRALVRQREHHPKTVLPPLYYTCSNRAGGDASPTRSLLDSAAPAHITAAILHHPAH